MTRLHGTSSPGGWILWAVVALMILAIAGLVLLAALRPKDDAAGGDVPERVVDVRTRTVEARRMADVVDLPGLLEPWADVHVAAEKAGRLVEMAVDLGDTVREGDLLWRVNDATWAAVVRRAEVEAREAERDWQRVESLRESGAVSASALDAARRARDMAAAGLEEARAHLAQCTVRSPIAGRIEERLADLGEHPSEGQVVLRVVETGRLKLVVHVPEQDVLSVTPGTSVRFTLSAVPGREFEGRVRFVSGVGRPGSNAFRTEIEVDNGAGELKAGMIASVKLVRRARDGVVAVPLAAVVPDKGEHVVFVVEDGRAVRRTVRLHAIRDQLAVIEDGLRGGEHLVVEGQRRLEDGRRVRGSEAGGRAPDAGGTGEG